MGTCFNYVCYVHQNAVRNQKRQAEHVSLLGEVAHEGVDLVGVAQMQVVLAVCQDVEGGVAVARDVRRKPLGVLLEADRVLGTMQHLRPARDKDKSGRSPRHRKARCGNKEMGKRRTVRWS